MVEKKANKGTPPLPPLVYAEVSVRSVGGVSLFETPKVVTSKTVPDFFSERQVVKTAISQLRKEGFDVLHVGPVTITVSAPATVYEQVFKTKIVAEERETIKEFGQVDTATFLECPDTAVPGLIDPQKSSLADIVEGVALSEPVYYFASPIPPSVPYWHLDVPDDVAKGLHVKGSITGRHVNVVMVDSGWFCHPFFTHHGCRGTVVLGPGRSNPDHDELGHGTGESANIFAVAPDVDFTMVKMSLIVPVGAFNLAASLRPDIISCSWGRHKPYATLTAADQALAAAVADAVRKGIIVIFSAGNGHNGFPAQHPDVIAAGGVYMCPDSSLEATPYASGFESKAYPGRKVPDVCGLVGLPPKAAYIMLPVEPNCDTDKSRSGGTHPEKDETAPDDGWAAFSGTSAAAPQIAGVCALMKHVWPELTPAMACKILKKTARDITEGKCAHGHPAGPGPDLATGHGLVDASRARGLTWLIKILYTLPHVPLPILAEKEILQKEIQTLEDILFESMD
jgi:subtilisin family serine protease